VYQSISEGDEMITRRDQDIFNFIEDFHVATCSQIQQLFFPRISKRYAQKRMQYLYDQGFLKRTRSTINNDYAYYIEKKSLLQQVHHDLIRAELYVQMHERYDVLEWHNEFAIDHIRPDALTYIKHKGVVYPVLIEIHLSKQFNFEKYRIDLVSLFGVRPTVLICTDRQVTIQPVGQKFKVIGLDMVGLNTLFT
jgi:hypothetical protein